MAISQSGEIQCSKIKNARTFFTRIYVCVATVLMSAADTITWDKLKATCLIALLHISNENTVYLFEIRRYIK